MRQRFFLLTFITLTLIVGFMYIVLPFCLTDHVTCMGSPSDPITSPGLYRLLTPTLEHFLAPAAGPYSSDILRIELMLQFVLTPAILGSLYLWLKRWTNADRALIGVLIYGMVQLVAYQYWFRPVNMELEVLFVICGLLAAGKPRIGALVVLTVLATLNRESGLMVAILYAFYHADQWRERRYQVTSVGLVLLWLVITAGLHAVLGPAPHVIGGLEGTWKLNIKELYNTFARVLPLAVLGLAVVYQYRRSPPPLRRLLWIVPIYMAALFVGSMWNEVLRLCLPIAPLCLPVMIYQPRITLSIATAPE